MSQSSASSTPLADAALAYAAAGTPVFACVPGAKRPHPQLARNGVLDASTDPELVRDWWRVEPEANIGLATGTTYNVLDVDVHPSGSGYEAYATLQRHGLIGPATHVVRTPSGGMHAYYPADTAHAQPSWSLHQHHLDARGNGGYVLAPPSATGEGVYTVVLANRPSHPVDTAVVRDWLNPPRSPQSSPGRERVPQLDRVRAWLQKQREGNRNNALYWATSRYVERGVPEATAQQDLQPIAAELGLADREIHRTINSAYQARGQVAQPNRGLSLAR